MPTRMKTQPINILLVDDDEDDCMLFKEALEEMNTHTNLEVLRNGEQLINYLKYQSTTYPDLLFLDLYMTHITGIDCLTEIKRLSHLQDIKIIIFSASEAPIDIENTFLKGAHLYMKKPHDFNDLKKQLSKVLNFEWHHHIQNLNRSNFILTL